MNCSRRTANRILATVAVALPLMALPLIWAAEATANPALPRSTSRPQWSSSSRSNAPAHRPSTPVHRASPSPQQRQLPAQRSSPPVVRSSQPVQYTPAHRAVSAPQRRCYTVFYRDCSRSPWVAYGCYYHMGDAQQAARYFQSMGYETFVR